MNMDISIMFELKEYFSDVLLLYLGLIDLLYSIGDIVVEEYFEIRGENNVIFHCE